MKVLVGIHDAEPGGFHETGSHDLVVVPALRALAGQREAFRGLVSQGGATLARVVETPACFRPAVADIAGRLRHTLALIEDLPVGAVVRPRFAGAGRTCAPGGGTLATEWVLDIEGPN